jgi:hypothetical protein
MPVGERQRPAPASDWPPNLGHVYPASRRAGRAERPGHHAVFSCWRCGPHLACQPPDHRGADAHCTTSHGQGRRSPDADRQPGPTAAARIAVLRPPLCRHSLGLGDLHPYRRRSRLNGVSQASNNLPHLGCQPGARPTDRFAGQPERRQPISRSGRNPGLRRFIAGLRPLSRQGRPDREWGLIPGLRRRAWWRPRSR